VWSVDCRYRRVKGRVRTGEELGVVEAGERDGGGAGTLAGAGGAALVSLDAGEAAGEAGAAGAPVLPRLLPALLARGPLLAGGVGVRVTRLRVALLPIVLHSQLNGAPGEFAARRDGEIYARVLA
jgi:hypothetical protein